MKGGEKNMNKNKTLSIVAISVIMISLLSLSKPAYAATNGSTGGNFFTGLIEYISQKFGLDKSQVKTAIKDYRQQRKANPEEWQNAEKKRLNNLVRQGKITTDQEKAILAELVLLRSKYIIDPSRTPKQRKTEMQNLRLELTTWAKAQGIDLKYILPLFGGRK